MPKKKIKLLFDMHQMTYFDSRKETGVFRLADKVLKSLLEKDDVDVYFYIDKNHQNVIKYLESNQYDYQNKLVYLPYLRKTTRNRNFFLTVKSKIYSAFLSKKYKNIISDFDWYFSPFDPISTIIYKTINSSIFVHDIIPIIYPEFVEKKFVKSYSKFIDSLNANLIFFNSQCSKDDFLNYRKDYDPNKTSIATPAADQKFKPIEDHNLIIQIKKKYNIRTPKYFLSVSDLNPRKNIFFIIKNFLSFIKENQINDLSLVLGGPNEQFGKNILTNLLQYENLFDKIILTGFVDDEDLPCLYSGATAFVYGSLYEGFGLPPLEAMQSGTPVVVSNIPSLKEVVGKNGLFFDPKNNDDFIKCLKKIYEDESLRVELSIGGIKVAQNFSWSKSVEQMVKMWFDKL